MVSEEARFIERTNHAPRTVGEITLLSERRRSKPEPGSRWDGATETNIEPSSKLLRIKISEDRLGSEPDGDPSDPSRTFEPFSPSPPTVLSPPVPVRRFTAPGPISSALFETHKTNGHSYPSRQSLPNLEKPEPLRKENEALDIINLSPGRTEIKIPENQFREDDRVEVRIPGRRNYRYE